MVFPLQVQDLQGRERVSERPLQGQEGEAAFLGCPRVLEAVLVSDLLSLCPTATVTAQFSPRLS